MLKKVLLPLVVFSLMGCSDQQADSVKAETTKDETVAAENALQSQDQTTVKSNAQTAVQPVTVSPSASTNVVVGIVATESTEDRASKKDQSMSKALLDAKLVVNDKANITLQYTNNQRYGVPLLFVSGMTADLWLLDPAGHRVWAWSNEMMFTQALRETVMPAGKTQNVKFTIPASVAAKITKGYSLKALFAGKATESQTPAMLPVTYQY